MMRLLLALACLLVACHHDGDAATKPEPDQGSSQPKLDLATVGPAPPHWTDQVPARIVFDETRTSR